MEAEDSSETLTPDAAIIYRNEALISCFYLFAFVFYNCKNTHRAIWQVLNAAAIPLTLKVT